jgi:uncharacterized membrane protein YfcA
MDWTVGQIAAIVASVSGGLLLQGAVGFGSGLFAVPLLLWAGVEMPVAIALLLGGVTVQTLVHGWGYRRHIAWHTMWGITVTRIIATPLGVALLGLLVAKGQELVKQVVGGVLLVVVLVQWLARVQARQHVHWAWTAVAGLLSGVMGGALGMGGPPVVLWVMAHDWPGKQVRVFYWVTFVMMIPLIIGLLSWRFGLHVLAGYGWGLALAPAVLLASAIGVRLGDRMDRHRLRTAARIALILIAISSIVGPLV